MTCYKNITNLSMYCCFFKMSFLTEIFGSFPGHKRHELTAKHLAKLVTCIHSESELRDLTNALGVRPPGENISPHQLNDSTYFILGHWYSTQHDPHAAYDKLTTLLGKAGKGQLLSSPIQCGLQRRLQQHHHLVTKFFVNFSYRLAMATSRDPV